MAQRKKNRPRHSTGAFRNHRTASVCSRRSSVNTRAYVGRHTDGDSERGKVRGPWGRRPLRRRSPLVAVLLLAVCRLEEMRVHCRRVRGPCAGEVFVLLGFRGLERRRAMSACDSMPADRVRVTRVVCDASTRVARGQCRLHQQRRKRRSESRMQRLNGRRRAGGQGRPSSSRCMQMQTAIKRPSKNSRRCLRS